MPNRTKSLELFYPHRDHPQRSVNLRMKFWCLQISQNFNLLTKVTLRRVRKIFLSTFFSVCIDFRGLCRIDNKCIIVQ